jgi:protein-tyrosine-phosphatase
LSGGTSSYALTKNARYNSHMPLPPTFRVLFVCIGNACRSPMAESIALREASDIIDPSSAGLFPLGYIPPSTQQTLQNNGYSFEGLTSKPALRDSWDNADLIINLSGRRSDPLFDHSEKVEDWDVADPFGGEPEIYQQILEEIAARIRLLADRLRQQRLTGHTPNA